MSTPVSPPVPCFNNRINYFQGIVGANGADGLHVLKPAEQAPGHVLEPNLDQIMADSNVQDHLPTPNIATQIVVQEKLVGGSWNKFVLLFEHPCFTLSILFQILNKSFSVDCTWNQWRSWSSCSRNGGSCTKTRSRTKNGPFNGGAPCSGYNQDSRSCNQQSCYLS